MVTYTFNSINCIDLVIVYTYTFGIFFIYTQEMEKMLNNKISFQHIIQCGILIITIIILDDEYYALFYGYGFWVRYSRLASRGSLVGWIPSQRISLKATSRSQLICRSIQEFFSSYLTQFRKPSIEVIWWLRCNLFKVKIEHNIPSF